MDDYVRSEDVAFDADDVLYDPVKREVRDSMVSLLRGFLAAGFRVTVWSNVSRGWAQQVARLAGIADEVYCTVKPLPGQGAEMMMAFDANPERPPRAKNVVYLPKS